MKIGILREGKTPPDKRVPLAPSQCQLLLQQYPQLEIFVQPSAIRAFADEEYQDLGIPLKEDLSDCAVLMGVKEVPSDDLIPGKTYFFFSHTYKQQPYNADLLRAILEKKIRLIDYELLKEPGGSRLLGFGRYAGIVGAYNAFRAYGEMKNTYSLKPAHQCRDRQELETELVKVQLPEGFRIALTGAGKVAMGAMEILSALKINQVFPEEYLKADDQQPPCFTQLSVLDYFRRKDGREFSREDFYASQEGYASDFMRFAACTHLYLACHYWSENSPYIFTREDVRSAHFNIELVSDISADIDGPVATTLRSSTIEEPFYGYHPEREEEVSFGTPGSIGVSAVDNLPCELPRDASVDFGNQLIKAIMPLLLKEDPEGILAAATETNKEGELTEAFRYLSDYVSG